MPPKYNHKNKKIIEYKQKGFITDKQFRGLSENHLLWIGEYNKKNNRKPRASQKGKTNKDFPKKNNMLNFKKGTASALDTSAKQTYPPKADKKQSARRTSTRLQNKGDKKKKK